MAALVLLGLAACGPGSPAEPQATLVLRNATVIDLTTGARLPGQMVLIADDRILKVAPDRTISVGGGATVVDATGQFVIPGLWDMHVHTLWDREVAEVFLPWFVAHGVTGVRDMGGTLKMLEVVRKGDETYPVRPRIIAAGPMLDGPEPVHPEISIALASDDAAREAVAALEKAGVDFVKVYTLLPRELFPVVAEEAARRGLPLAGHLPAQVTPEEAAAAGMRSIEHLRDEIEPFCFGESPERCAQLLALFRQAPVWQTPTLSVLRAKAHASDPGFVDLDLLERMPEVLVADWEGGRQRQALAPESYRAEKRLRFGQELELIGRMHAAGVPLLAGTDAGVLFSVPGVSLHEELALLVEAGLSPLEALRTATVEPARFLDRLDDFGAVTAGKVADLVVLDADPLLDIANTYAIAGVVVGGRWIAREELDSLIGRELPLAEDLVQR